MRAAEVAVLALLTCFGTSCDDARQRAADAARAAATPAAVSTYRPAVDRDRELVKEMLAVNLVEKAFLPKDVHSDRIRNVESFRFRYRNTGSKEIRAFRGDVVFSDLSGREFFRVDLTSEAHMMPGATEIEDRKIELDHFTPRHDQLVATPLENLSIRFEPQSIVFADGTRVGSVEADASSVVSASEARSVPQREADQAAEAEALARWREEGKAAAKRVEEQRLAEAKARHMHEDRDGFMHCDPGYVSSNNECVPGRPEASSNEYWTGRDQPGR